MVEQDGKTEEKQTRAQSLLKFLRKLAKFVNWDKVLEWWKGEIGETKNENTEKGEL